MDRLLVVLVLSASLLFQRRDREGALFSRCTNRSGRYRPIFTDQAMHSSPHQGRFLTALLISPALILYQACLVAGLYDHEKKPPCRSSPACSSWWGISFAYFCCRRPQVFYVCVVHRGR
jgi:hypothetical protein